MSETDTMVREPRADGLDELADDLREFVHLFPDALVFAVADGPFHLVAEPPKEQGGVVLVFADGVTHRLALRDPLDPPQV